MLTNLWAYVVVGSAVIGILLSQSAFKAARLDYSLPPIAAAEPLVGILLGVTLLGDVVSVSITGLAVEALCLVAMVAGVAMIGRSSNLAAGCPTADAALQPGGDAAAVAPAAQTGDETGDDSGDAAQLPPDHAPHQYPSHRSDCLPPTSTTAPAEFCRRLSPTPIPSA